jgi:hypothetical protein
MTPRTVVAAVLLLFVAASVAALIVKEVGSKPAQTPPPTNTPAPPPDQHAQGDTPEPDKLEVARVVVYYFHGNVRCTTCRTIEAYAKEAVDASFAGALQDGRLEWRVVNVEDAGNGHFVEDFQLSTRSIVLERIADGERKEWKNLDRVWELVRGDKEIFLKYIRDETTAFVEAAGG